MGCIMSKRWQTWKSHGLLVKRLIKWTSDQTEKCGKTTDHAARQLGRGKYPAEGRARHCCDTAPLVQATGGAVMGFSYRATPLSGPSTRIRDVARLGEGGVAASGRRRGRGDVQQTALRVMLSYTRVMLSDTRVMLSDTRVMLSDSPFAVRAAQQGRRTRSSAGHW
jgi:hypothetical protein